MGEYLEIRTRELTDMGSWPWRYIVEGLEPGYYRQHKSWPWSRPRAVWVEQKWVQLRHGLRDYQPCQIGDAFALADHYRPATPTKDTPDEQ